ncbi:MAG: AMP-binding protein [Candidatus Omnitrophica bacterium]|nr:AMP-binding protein [Candidatus Omnitrophota bacterium]
MARNLCEAFTRMALKRKSQVAVLWKKDGRWIKVSYGQLQDNISACSSAMRSYYGVKNGDRVAIALGNRPEWPTVFFAILYAGAIPVPVNAQGSSGDLENILARAECSIIFTESGCPSLKIKAVSVDSDEFKHALSLPREECCCPARRDDIACIMYTSGTTSHPKGVMLSHGNLLSNIYSLYKLGFMKSGDGIVSVLPLYHAYAMVVTTLTPIIYGGKVVYPGSIRAREVMSAMRESGASLFIGVPLIFEMFHKTIKDSLGKLPGPIRFLVETAANIAYFIRRRTGVNIARYLFYGIHLSLGRAMRVYMSGGAKLSENIERDLFKFGLTVLNGYGITETSPVLTVNSFKRPKPGSVGLPLKNVEIRIGGADKNGIGEIFVRGPNVMKGYYKNEALTRSVIKDGWFRTGDIGHMDKDGYLFLAGRVDDAITLGTGLSMCPDELEEAYSAEALIKEICIFDTPSPKGKIDAVVIWAVVVPNMKFFSAKGITNPYHHVKTAFEKVSRDISIPERLMGFSITLDDLPRTLIGKVIRREVKKRYLSGQIKEAFRPNEKRLTKKDLSILQKPEAGRVIDCLRAWTQAGEISPNDSFELDLGIDLAGRAELAFELERKLGLRISEEEINGIFTVGELIARAENISRDKVNV